MQIYFCKEFVQSFLLLFHCVFRQGVKGLDFVVYVKILFWFQLDSFVLTPGDVSIYLESIVECACVLLNGMIHNLNNPNS